MLRLGKHFGDRALLYDVPLLHHRDALGKVAHQVKVMGDQQYRHAVLALQLGQQVENATAQTHVQGRGGLVSQQQLRAASQCHRDHCALALPAAQLVRVARRPACRFEDAGARYQFNSCKPGASAGQALFQLQNFSDLVADGEQRVQRRHWLLEDHRDVLPANAAQRVL